MADPAESSGGAAPASADAPHGHKEGFLALALGALGVVFGDIGTSPLYAMREALAHSRADVPSELSVLGVVSLITWALILVVTVKYVAFLMRADNKGEGGTLALMALAQRALSQRSGAVLFLGMVGAALFYGDGVITPAISVLGAVEGLRDAPGVSPELGALVLPISATILITLFLVQSRGTASIAKAFGPITAAWFLILGGLGLFHIFDSPSVLRGLLPHYGVIFLIDNGFVGFVILGSVFLAVTGAEALYADMGHFGRRPIHLAWYGFALIALLLSYFGQGAWLLTTTIDKQADINPFFEIIPNVFMIPMIILATAASIIAGQAVISGMFSLANQAIKLNFFPRIKILHTSLDERGQIYVPFINSILLVGGVLLVLTFRSSSALASSYGFAVSATMFLTTTAFSLVIIYIWNWQVWKTLAFLLFAIPLDFIYLAATITKLPAGHFFTLIISLIVSWLLIAWYLGNHILVDRAQRIDISLCDFSELIEMREDLLYAKRPAIFLQHLPIAPEADVTPNALLRQIQVTSLLYQPTIIVEFVDSPQPTLADDERVTVRNYANNIHVVQLTFGYWETTSIRPVIEMGKVYSWWKDESEVIYFGIREDLRLSRSSIFLTAIKYSYFLLHKLDRPVSRELNLNGLRYIELGAPIDM